MTTQRSAITIGVSGMRSLVEVLRADEYDVVAPVVRGDALVARTIDSFDELPIGWGMSTEPGRAHLRLRADRARFGWALPAQSWKPIVHPARMRTLTMSQAEPDAPVLVSVAPRSPRRHALLGVRPCELAALDRLDTVLGERPPSPEPIHAALRSDALVIVVNCHSPAETCFCSSMGTGPHVDDHSDRHDLEISELLDPPDDDGEPRYVVTAISEAGGRIVDRLEASATPTTASDLAAVAAVRDDVARSIARSIDAPSVRASLPTAHDDSRWDEIAQRCVACGNCTAVCPTCFCTRLDDVGDLSGTRTERWRTWESCFSLEFSRLGDTTVRTSVAARYRQWMTHKLATWFDQYGESGCVGCGRCTTWCPVGIDFAAEASRFLDDAMPEPQLTEPDTPASEHPASERPASERPESEEEYAR